MPQGLNIISVSDEPAGTIEPFIKRNEMDYPVARAQGVTGLYGTDSIPYACLINAVGTVIWEGHPANLNSGVIQSALQATPVAPNTSSSTSGESNWWVWFILGAGVLFAGAVGWFVWSTRDKTPRQVQMDWQPQPQQGPPQQPGAPPPGGYGSPPPGNYGGPAPQQPGQGYLAGPAQPQAGQGYLNDGAPQTLGYNAPPPTPGTGMHPGVGGGNSYAGGERLTDNTEFLEPRKDAPFLGGNPDDEEFPPFDTNQNRPGNPYR